MDILNLVTGLAGVVGIVVSVFGALVELRLRTRARDARHTETIQQRIMRLTNSLSSAARLIGQIEREIEERSKLATKLESDVQTYNEIAALKKQEVEAVAQVFRGEIKAEGKRSFWVSFGVNLLFFVLGIIATVVVSLLMSPEH